MRTANTTAATFVAALCLSLTINDLQGQSVSELTLDFGCVEVGATGSDVLTVTNDTSKSIDIVSVSISVAGQGFSTNLDSLPFAIEITPQSTYDINVDFVPPGTGDSDPDTFLVITFKDIDGADSSATVQLVGTGGVAGEPCVVISEIIRFYDNAVDDDNNYLNGTGNANQQDRRENAMRNRLTTVGFLVDGGHWNAAAAVNASAILRCNDDPYDNDQELPVDFVEGSSDVESLNSQLEALQVILDSLGS